MSPARFIEVLDLLGWRAGSVARQCGYSSVSGFHWRHGRLAIPALVAQWLELRVKGVFEPAPPRPISIARLEQYRAAGKRGSEIRYEGRSLPVDAPVRTEEPARMNRIAKLLDIIENAAPGSKRHQFAKKMLEEARKAD